MTAATDTPEAEETVEPDASRDGSVQVDDGAKKVIAQARKAERDAGRRAAEAEAKIKEYEDRDKSETDKAKETVSALQAEADAAKTEALRTRVALEKKIPVDLIDRLRGSSREELEADADELLKLVTPETTSFDGGARTPAPASGMDAQIRRAAGY